MGEAKRRKSLGHSSTTARLGGEEPRARDHRDKEVASQPSPSPGTENVPLTFSEARDLTTREGATCWTWVPRRHKGRIVGADTYVSYLDVDSEEGYGDGESTGEAWVVVEGDYWADPTIGEQGDSSMEDLEGEARESVWYRTNKDRFGLPDFSFHRLRDLGCTDPTVLAQVRAYDDEA